MHLILIWAILWTSFLKTKQQSFPFKKLEAEKFLLLISSEYLMRRAQIVSEISVLN